MAGLDANTLIPTDVKLHQASRVLELVFPERPPFPAAVRISARVFAVGRSARPRARPGDAADRQARRDDHAKSSRSATTRCGPTFSDGHDTGIYSWDYLYDLGERAGRAVATTTSQRLAAAGASRDPGSHVDDTIRTYFGYERVTPDEKTRRVRGVFDSVAGKYDLMNDLMSRGPASRRGSASPSRSPACAPGERVLDLAGGTGDLARLFAERVGSDRRGRAHRHQRRDARRRPRQADRPRRRAADRPVQRRGAAVRAIAASTACRSPSACATSRTRNARLPRWRACLRRAALRWCSSSRACRGPLAPLYDWYSFNVLPRARAARRQRRGELPLSRRIDPRASRPGGTEGDDGTIGLRSRRLLQSGRRRRRAARRTRILRAGIEARLYPPKCGRRLTRAAIARI